MNSPPDIPGSGEGPSPSTGTSRSLLERVQADDAAAWDRLVSLYAPLVHQWCRGAGLREQDIADVFQEVFQAVAAHVATFRRRRQGDPCRGWLGTTRRNRVYAYFRRRGREPGGVGGSDAQARLAQLPAPQPRDEGSGSAEEGESALFRRALDLIRGEFAERTWQAFWRT